MKRCFALLVGLILLFSCREDEVVVDEGTNEVPEIIISTWATYIQADRDSEEVTLNIFRTTPDYESYDSIQDPLYFEVLYSTNGEDYELVGTVSRNEVVGYDSYYTIPSLDNNQLYFFKVKSVLLEGESQFSNTVSSIPSDGPIPSEIFPTLEFNPSNLYISPDQSYLTYYDHGPDQMLYLLNTTTGEQSALSYLGGTIAWNKNNQNFIYTKYLYDDQGVDYMPLMMMDAEKGVETELRSDVLRDFEQLYLNTGEIHDDHLYFISKPYTAPGEDAMSLWQLDLNTKELAKVVDFNDLGFWPAGHDFSLSSDGSKMYLSGFMDFTGPKGFYEWDFASSQLSHIVDVPDARNPIISPDDSKIAYISRRSGYNDVWCFDLSTKSYIQLTGGDFQGFDKGNSDHITWLSNNEIATAMQDRSGESTERKLVRIALD